MIWCVRTTLTIDEDVAVRLERLRTDRGLSLKQVVNEALRLGLAALEQGTGRRRPTYRTRAVSLGRARLANLDNVAEALAVAEGEDFR
jgi:hypothetical protein